MHSLNECADEISNILELSTSPVAVFLLERLASPFTGWRTTHKCRFCQAVMKARHGQTVLLLSDDLSCPAAARAFGFRPLPERLRSGEGLVNFGIVREAITGKEMFDGMPVVDEGSLKGVALCPLQIAPSRPDVIIVEGSPEQLMWLLLADLNCSSGRRRSASTAVLQATCVDATVIPFKEKRLNFSLGCYGCREATDLAPAETVLGFPIEILEELTNSLVELAAKAIPRSRAKNPLKLMEQGALNDCGP